MPYVSTHWPITLSDARPELKMRLHHLGIRQTAFATYINVAPNTVTRWDWLFPAPCYAHRVVDLLEMMPRGKWPEGLR